LTGESGGKMKEVSHFLLNVSSNRYTRRIEKAILCWDISFGQLVEEKYFNISILNLAVAINEMMRSSLLED